MTVKDKLYPEDEKDRYFHIYHSTVKEHGEKEELEETLERLGKVLKAQYGNDYQLSESETDTLMLIMIARESFQLLQRKAT